MNKSTVAINLAVTFFNWALEISLLVPILMLPRSHYVKSQKLSPCLKKAK
ncbi:hypothetical protein [Candidatus Protochlamydia amoebophila]|nr:hypothetical protein [Candidatus Protochlamydia amoebophila]